MAKSPKSVATAATKVTASKIVAQKSKRAIAEKRTPRKTTSPGSSALVRPDTKLARLITLLDTEDGATTGDLTKATGWQAHSVRGAISGTLKKKLGLTVTSVPVEGRGRVYRITNHD